MSSPRPAAAQPSITPSAAEAVVGDTTRRGVVPVAGQTNDDRALAWLAWTAGRDGRRDWQPALETIVSERIDADAFSPPVDFALDGLIELSARLPPDLLARIAEHRPTEALILLAHVDDGTADGVALAILERERSYGWFAAANLLLERRPQGYVARLLTGLRLRTRITISASGESASGGIAGVGIGCGAYRLEPGMPPWPSYRLTPFAQPGHRVLALGPTPIYYQRVVTPAGTGPSHGGLFTDGPTGADRLRYVETLTGQRAPLRDGEHHAVRQHASLDVTAFEARVKADLRRRHARFLRDLVEAGHLSEVEAAGLDVEIDIEVSTVDRG